MITSDKAIVNCTQPPLWPGPATAAAALGPLARRCDIVFTGADEATLLWGAPAARDIGSVLGPRGAVFVKDGARSASSVEAGRITTVPALPAQVVEPVGAGDAFAAGFLYARLRQMSFVEALRLGHLVASSALTSPTDHADLLAPPAELEKMARSEESWPEGDPMTWAGGK